MPGRSRSSHSSSNADAGAGPSRPRKVLVLYAPIFHPHLAIEPTTPSRADCNDDDAHSTSSASRGKRTIVGLGRRKSHGNGNSSPSSSAAAASKSVPSSPKMRKARTLDPPSSSGISRLGPPAPLPGAAPALTVASPPEHNPFNRSLSDNRAAPKPQQEDANGMLDMSRSRPIHLLQEAGRHVVEHLEERLQLSKSRSKSKSSSEQDEAGENETITINLFSILPASYTRSRHPAFNHRTSASPRVWSNSGSHHVDDEHSLHAAHRTTSKGSANSGSSSEAAAGAGKSGTKSPFSFGFRGRSSNAHSHSMHTSHSGHGSTTPGGSGGGALSTFANFLHKKSPASSRGVSRSNSRRGSMHHFNGAGSGSGPASPSLSAHAAADALLELTDVLRIEDEATEEAREQLLDRLTILAGEMDDYGEERRRAVNVDVRQAGDGETLLEALHALVREERDGYDELVVLNDAEWEAHQHEHEHDVDEGKKAGMHAASSEDHMPISAIISGANSPSPALTPILLPPAAAAAGSSACLSPTSPSSPTSPCPGLSATSTATGATASTAATSSNGAAKPARKKLHFDLSKLHFPHHSSHSHAHAHASSSSSSSHSHSHGVGKSGTHANAGLLFSSTLSHLNFLNNSSHNSHGNGHAHGHHAATAPTTPEERERELEQERVGFAPIGEIMQDMRLDRQIGKNLQVIAL